LLARLAPLNIVDQHMLMMKMISRPWSSDSGAQVIGPRPKPSTYGETVRVATSVEVEKSAMSWGTAPERTALLGEMERVAKETAMVSSHFLDLVKVMGFRGSEGSQSTLVGSSEVPLPG
jgi:hypothetical protein